MQQLKNLQYFFRQPKALRIHVGAHKTATTHLQDALKLCKASLELQGICYIPIDAFRYKLRLLDQNRVFSQQGNWLEKRYTLTSKLFSVVNNNQQRIVLSEENILGRVTDALYISPYPAPNVDFINYATTYTDISVFLSIRSFSQIYPAAYATGLKFFPEEAIRLKHALQEALDKGLRPSWVPVVKRLEAQMPRCQLKCWTFERYKSHQTETVSRLLGVSIDDLPAVENPTLTATPGVEAIREAEAQVASGEHRKVKKWFKVCGDIYRANQACDGQPKYTFLTPAMQKELDEQYLTDIATLTPDGYFT
ncbi:hypothetical protein FBQ74_05170 [Salinimonas iocasae]|uniref:Sulfotransferase domain-containing protein n=1 Tax=Salinimonas iocasae TaxID=2572577 RepID=A0A5B7YBN9_9ALTE|nr:hypothetical protein FBQ74_05170 [Salinimonas iocasae]